MSIEMLMRMIKQELPDITKRGDTTIRAVALFLDDTEWRVMAGGHYAVDLGEYNGDYSSQGETAAQALERCLMLIRNDRLFRPTR